VHEQKADNQRSQEDCVEQSHDFSKLLVGLLLLFSGVLVAIKVALFFCPGVVSEHAEEVVRELDAGLYENEADGRCDEAEHGIGELRREGHG